MKLENDERPWLTLCVLTDDTYVFYMGECDYTGFDCVGRMILYASKHPEILVEYAMSDENYRKYMEDTKPVESWDYQEEQQEQEDEYF